jgi:thiamine biosynthesis lipoprotein
VVEGGDFGAALALFRERERIFSRFEPGTELNRVNAAPEQAVHVSPEFARALRMALRAAATTDGLVDVTTTPAPDADAVVAPAGRWRELHLDGCVLRRPPGVLLDLGGVVRSQTVDDALRVSGARLVSVGDLAVSQPTVVALPGAGTIPLAGGGVATIGGGKRRGLRGGSWRHHLVDPRSGRPSTSRWDEVTVAAPSCLQADVAANAAFLLSGDGPDWLDERGLPGRFRAAGRMVDNRSWKKALSNFLGGFQVPLRHAVGEHGVRMKGRGR